MKICFVFGNLCVSDGVARAATGIANVLADHGHQITLIPLYRIEKEAESRLDGRIRVKPVFNTYFKGMAKLVRLFFPQFLLEKLCFDDHYDIEVAFQYDVPTLMIGRSTHRDSLHYCWMHGYDDGLVFRKSYMKMDRIFCVSRYNAERLGRELGPGAPDVGVCYNILDDVSIVEKGKTPTGLPHERFTFVTVGRLSPEKGFLRLLGCISKLREEGFDIGLWVVGDGPQRGELLAERKRLGLEQHVVFTGAKNNPYPYTGNGDCFVCSSYSEGYSTVCAESIILGTPVISTRVPGADEIIADAEAGMVVENDDSALYGGMKYVLEHPDVLDAWRKTITSTRARFCHENRERRILSIFEG
jgi:glycosyltransferase involved in cell wall biosynthesis